MAAAYLEPLVRLLENLQLEQVVDCNIECRHFFSGAAVYADGRICASWSPVGLAFKLSSIEAAELIANGSAKPLKYFPKGALKKDYVLFENPLQYPAQKWEPYFIKAIEQLR